jgi:hypothetical protein
MSRLVTNAIRSTSASSDAITLDGSGNATFPANVTCSGTATGFGGGKILQVKYVVKKDVFSFTTTASTISTSGDITGLTITITPSNANNKILLMPTLNLSDNSMYVTLYKNGTLIDQVGDAANNGQGNALQRVMFGGETNTTQCATYTGILQDTAGSTSAITYSIRLGTYHMGSSTYNLYINRVEDADEHINTNIRLARYISTFTAMEVAA